MHITEAIKKLVDNQSLGYDEAYLVCLEIMEGNATPAQIGSFLTALRMKGESVEEITGFCKAMREKMIKIDCGIENLVDTCGTGGDGLRTFNVSTASAFIIAGAGGSVAKHGNKSVSSICGSADLVSGLGIKFDLSPEMIKKCIEDIGIGFLFAPLFHPAMKFAIAPRKEIGIRTVFNLLGPLCNPANVRRQIIGVCQKEFMEKIATSLKNLNMKHCLVVCGADGMDEITTTTKTFVKEIKNGKIIDYEINPEDFNFRNCKIEEIQVKNSDESMKSFLDVLNGVSGPKTDIAILNAGAGIYVSGMAASLKEGMELARESVFSGSAMNKFKKLKEYIDESIR
ncbi:MAG: anthranilate phosphoribosyltransferase [candidate division WOR-3 bacterium]